MRYEDEAAAVNQVLATLGHKLQEVAAHEEQWSKKLRGPDMSRPEWQALTDMKDTSIALSEAVSSIGLTLRDLLDDLAARPK